MKNNFRKERMSLEEIVAEIREPDCLEVLRAHWEESQAVLPKEPPSFLNPSELNIIRQWAGFPDDAQPILEKVANQIINNPALFRLAWHCYYMLVIYPRDYRFDKWPTLEHILGDSKGVFYLLVGLGLIPKMQEVYRSMNIPENIIRDTCLALSSMATIYSWANNGQLGLRLGFLNWLRMKQLKGQIFRIGRFEYESAPSWFGIEIYRNRKTNEVIALAENKARFTREGYIDADPSRNEFETSLNVSDEEIMGYPISPYGKLIFHKISLPVSEWERILRRGDLALVLHIPVGDMTLERCMDSMDRAFKFFDEYLLEKSSSVIITYSWIFSPCLEEILPPTSNLVRFMREVYLFPYPTSDREGFYYIFGADNIDIHTAPRKTTLQRAVLDYISAGKRWRGGGMFFVRGCRGYRDPNWIVNKISCGLK